MVQKKGELTIDDVYSYFNNVTEEGTFDYAISKFNTMFLGLLEKLLEDILNANPEIEDDHLSRVTGNKVFIVHGHDDLIKKDLQILLIRAGVNHVVLHEQPDKGRTIIEKLLDESESCNYAIGIFTPDDILETGVTRARQNVIWEMGYFLGKLGQRRVRMIIKDAIDIPSDLSGILYTKHDENSKWKVDILRELQAIGIYVDIESAMKSI